MFRKISGFIEKFLKSGSGKVLVINGAKKIGKTFIIRETGRKLFKNYIEINLLEDSLRNRLFDDTHTVDDFYLQLSTLAGDRMHGKKTTLIFLDEIQVYPHLFALLKFLKNDDRFTYIASSSLSEKTLGQVSSLQLDGLEICQMYPMDFEEFLIANSFQQSTINSIRKKFQSFEELSPQVHEKMLDMFKKYLLVGGLPDAVKAFVGEMNVMDVRKIQDEIHKLYCTDAAKFDIEKNLKTKRIYEMIPSNLKNKKKRIVVQAIENKKGKRFSDYQKEFDYLLNSGTALEVQATSKPSFPLNENSGKKILKLYLNDVGILTNILYKNDIRAILDDKKSIELGSVYESAVAQELRAHGFNLFYYDDRLKGEVDFLIDDYESESVIPFRIKSGKNYSVHSALTNFMVNTDYEIKKAFVFSNDSSVVVKEGICYMPIYYCMFFEKQ
ncbi:AAA family ATPase [Treponema sp. UBA3813]|uniref:ATP-binding protein n=1 Tax=Treponema sp. UBA3813 TaxID=1947715 RepID=UPI0025DDFFB4|nr:AAA family ATPase [Treponema sp. UBA3813]